MVNAMSKKSKARKLRRLQQRLADGVLGPLCPRCQQRTQVHRHPEITPALLGQPFYYSEWYRCTNRSCRTTNIMPQDKRVYAQPYAGDVALEVLAASEQQRPRELAASVASLRLISEPAPGQLRNNPDDIVFDWAEVKALCRGLSSQTIGA